MRIHDIATVFHVLPEFEVKTVENKCVRPSSFIRIFNAGFLLFSNEKVDKCSLRNCDAGFNE